MSYTSINLKPTGQLKVSYTESDADEFAIYPRIRFVFDVSYLNNSPGAGLLFLDGFEFTAVLRSASGVIRLVGNLLVDMFSIKLSPSGSYVLYAFLDLDSYRLSEIEKLRQGGELSFILNGRFSYTQPAQISTREVETFQLAIKIPRSQWVDNILAKTGFKNVSLLEIPTLPNGEHKEIVKWIESASRQNMMGEYDKVLGDCRKTLEGLTSMVKNRGFKTKDSEGHEISDWEKYFGNEELGDIFGGLCQKMFGFTIPGAHYGKGINREDADLALMVTHAMTNFVLKKSPP